MNGKWHKNRRQVYANGCSLGSLLAGATLILASPAHAQESPAAEPQSTSPAQPQDQQVTEDIVVTAQFRSQRLQETPLAITALNADMLEKRGISNISDIASAAPSVSFKQGTGIRSGAQLYIRGVGQFDFNLAQEPGVGVYIDDVYFGTVYGADFDLLDLDRVEVLRGPQGTLAGANSIGGAIKLFSQKPSDDGSGFVEAGYGSNQRRVLRGAANVTLVPDKLYARFSGGVIADNGYVKRVDFACARPAEAGSLPRQNLNSNNCNLGNAGGKNNHALRAALRWTPDDRLEVNLSADYQRNTAQPSAAVGLIYLPGVVGSAFQQQMQAKYGVQLDNRFATRPGQYINYATFLDQDYRNLAFDPNQSSTAWGVSAVIDYRLSDNLALKSITAYRQTRGYLSDDLDSSPLPANTESYNISHKQYTQELRLSGATDNKFLEWTVGGFYYHADNIQAATIDVPQLVANLGGFFFQANDPETDRNYAGYVTATIHPTSKLSLIGGYRYTRAKKEYTFVRYDPNPAGVIYLLGIDKLGASPPAVTKRSDYRLSAQYQWTSRIMTYAQYATGFKSGGINPRPSTPAQQVPFGPETLQSYEIGLKSQLFDRLLRLNLAGFISKYKDLQVVGQARDNDGILANFTTNAGAATIKGIEAEVELRPLDGLSIDGSFSYLHFKYDTLGAAANQPGGPCLSCTQIYTPKYKGNAGIQYEAPLPGRLGTLTPRFDVEYTGTVFTDANNDPRTRVPHYTVANARVTWRPADPAWQVTFAVTNLFDNWYYSNVNGYLSSNGYAAAILGRPREAMLTVRRTF